jgi:hypothetical protein
LPIGGLLASLICRKDIGCPQRVNPHTENAQKIPTRVTLSLQLFALIEIFQFEFFGGIHRHLTQLLSVSSVHQLFIG